jgi:hypothetical protein
MNKKVFYLALGALFLPLSVRAEAQQPKKVPRIGYLSVSDQATESTRSEAIRLALRELQESSHRVGPVQNIDSAIKDCKIGAG